MYIKDPIYGLIKVSEICKKFIDTPEFQRLKRVRQLGMTPEVFPSGVHSRAEHCLGVMHISGEYFRYLIINSDEKWKKYSIYQSIIEIAGLLHDIGHGPKSHLFEEAMKIRDIKFSHEEFSAQLIERINNRLNILNDEEVMLIKNIILGKKVENYPPFLFEIVSNKDSGLDTDKMDYLRRDAWHLGMPVISVDYIIKHCKIDKYGHVSYSEKTINDIRAIFTTRKNMFQQVYFHKTVAKIDKMMICAICQIPIDENDPDIFLKLDDGYLEYLIRYELKHDIIRCLDNRELDHNCPECPGIKLKRTAKLSGDTDDDPLLYVRFYDREKK